MRFFVSILRDLFRSLFIMARFLLPENLKCLKQIFEISAENKISLKAALEISLNYFARLRIKRGLLK